MIGKLQTPEGRKNIKFPLRVGLILVAALILASCVPKPVQTMVTSEAYYHQRETETYRGLTEAAPTATPVNTFLETETAAIHIRLTEAVKNSNCMTDWGIFNSSLNPGQNLDQRLAKSGKGPTDCVPDAEIIIARIYARNPSWQDPQWEVGTEIARWCYGDIMGGTYSGAPEAPEGFFASMFPDPNNPAAPGTEIFAFRFTGAVCLK